MPLDHVDPQLPNLGWSNGSRDKWQGIGQVDGSQERMTPRSMQRKNYARV